MSTDIKCPTWCETKHITDDYAVPGDDDRPAHEKRFGDLNGARVDAWIQFGESGQIKDSGFIFSLEEADSPEDMDEIAGWCTAAAAFMREIRGSMVTA